MLGIRPMPCEDVRAHNCMTNTFNWGVFKPKQGVVANDQESRFCHCSRVVPIA